MPAKINNSVLMSGVDFFDDSQAINPFMNKDVKIDKQKAKAEHQAIVQALKDAGVEVKTTPPPQNCQDGVYTANWGIVRNGKAVLSNLPNARKNEEPYAEQALNSLGLTTYKMAEEVRFSGQGDALPCGNFLFIGTGYRTDKAAHDFVADKLGYQIVALQTIPKRDKFGFGKPAINRDSGWPDSYFYDIDLALAVLRPPNSDQKGLIAWCPKAFVPESRAKLAAFDGVDKIEVDFNEAKHGFACNLVSTGETVVMSAKAPKFKKQLEKLGFKVVMPQISELAKGGGYIRCTTLTLNNA
jgi:N-dimethylarginine dimethylaminohydrolase